MVPVLDGIHHLKFPVSDLPAAIDWFGRALGGTRLPDLDHHDREGALFAVVISLPGLSTPVQLRLDGQTAGSVAGYDPVSFGVADLSALEDWVTHLDAAGIEHSPVVPAFAGHVVALSTPDRVAIRLFAPLPAGPDAAGMSPTQVDLDNHQVTGAS